MDTFQVRYPWFFIVIVLGNFVSHTTIKALGATTKREREEIRMKTKMRKLLYCLSMLCLFLMATPIAVLAED